MRLQAIKPTGKCVNRRLLLVAKGVFCLDNGDFDTKVQHKGNKKANMHTLAELSSPYQSLGC